MYAIPVNIRGVVQISRTEAHEGGGVTSLIRHMDILQESLGSSQQIRREMGH